MRVEIGPWKTRVKFSTIEARDGDSADESWIWDVEIVVGLVWFVGFYGLSTFVGYLKPNPISYK